MAQLQVTEHKSKNREEYIMYPSKSVRIFINNDIHYGYWCDEKFLVDFLTESQQKLYFDGNNYENTHFEILDNVANTLVMCSTTPYSKKYIVVDN